MNSRKSVTPLFGYVFVLWVSAFLLGCGATRTLKPLGKGNSQVHLSVGGPLITMGAPIPVPYTVLGYDYGFNDWMNLHGSIHPTAAVYKTLATELGATFGLVSQDGAIPEIAFDTRVVVASDFKNSVAFPILTPIVSYQWGRYSPYLGMDHLFQFHDNDRVYTPQTLAPFLGFRARLWERWQLGTEVKWSAINHDLTYNNIDHPKALGTNRGDLAPYIYVSYDFN